MNTAKKLNAAKKTKSVNDRRQDPPDSHPLPDPPEYIQHVAELYKESANFCGIEEWTESVGVVVLQTSTSRGQEDF